MKLLLTLFLILTCSPVFADSLSLESGIGTQITSAQNNTYSNYALVYNKPLSNLFYTEFRAASLNSSFNPSASIGMQLIGDFDIFASIGGSYLTSIPTELTGNMQFLLTGGVRFHIYKNYGLTLSLRHLSNGSHIFGWNKDKPNMGVEHFCIGLTYNF